MYVIIIHLEGRSAYILYIKIICDDDENALYFKDVGHHQKECKVLENVHMIEVRSH